MKTEWSQCAKCPYKVKERFCRDKNGKAPSFCATKHRPDLIEKSLQEYQSSDIRELARQSSIQEADGYANRELGYDHLKPIKEVSLRLVTGLP